MEHVAIEERAKTSITPVEGAPAVKHQPRSKRWYFDVGIGSVCLAGPDTGGAYCLLEASLAPGIGVPRHTHTREDESYYVTAGELEVIVGNRVFVLKEGDSLMAPAGAVAPTERQLQGGDSAMAMKRVLELATEYGILFG